MQSFGCVLKRRCTERCTFSENLPEGWNAGTALEKKQEDGRFCRAYLRTMDPEQAAAEIGRRDGYAMLGQKGTQQKLERMRCDAAAQLIARYRVTNTQMIVTMVVNLLSNPRLAEYDLSSICRLSGGGAAMPEAVATRLKELCRLDYIEGYGMSETIAPTHINPPERPMKQCLGIPIFDVDARVVDPATLAEQERTLEHTWLKLETALNDYQAFVSDAKDQQYLNDSKALLAKYLAENAKAL